MHQRLRFREMKSQKGHFYRKTVANTFNKYRLKEQSTGRNQTHYTVTCVYRSPKLLKFTLELDPQCLNSDTPKGGMTLVRSHILKATGLKMLSLNIQQYNLCWVLPSGQL